MKSFWSSETATKSNICNLPSHHEILMIYVCAHLSVWTRACMHETSGLKREKRNPSVL